MDKFDDIWKNRFNSVNLPDEAWNSPDNQVWESIAKTLPQPKKDRKIPFLFWIGVFSFVSLLIGLLLATMYFQYQTNNNKNTPPVEVSQKEIIYTHQKEQKSIATPTNQFENRPATLAQQITAGAKLIDTRIADLASSRKTETPPPFSTASQTRLDLKAAAPVVEERLMTEAHTLSNKETPQAAFSNLVPLAYLGLLPLDSPQPKFDYPSKNQRPNKNSKLKLSSHAGVVFWQHQLNKDLNNALTPFDFKSKNGVGLHLAVEIAYSFNPYLDLYTGIGYEQIAVTSGHNSPIQYSLLEELNESNNRYTLALATPYGFTNSSFELQRNTPISEEEIDLLVDFTNKHRVKNISLPFGIRLMPFGDHSTFKPSIALGLGVNYLASINNNLSNIDTHHNALSYQSDSANLSRQETQTFFLDYRLGGGLRYQQEQGIDIGIDYRFSKGLSPVFKSGDFTSTINRHTVTIKLIKTLK